MKKLVTGNRTTQSKPFYWPLSVVSADGETVETVKALVGTRATFTMFPASMLRRLGIVPQRRVSFELPDESFTEHDIGEARLRINDAAGTRIVVFGNEDDLVVIGVHTLEGFALEIDSEREMLVPARGLLMRVEG